MTSESYNVSYNKLVQVYDKAILTMAPDNAWTKLGNENTALKDGGISRYGNRGTRSLKLTVFENTVMLIA